jgi:medium-chain acyl-[acyl-carrier-protein] hydrolase
MKHENKILVRSYNINRFGELSTSFLFYQMQEIAWEHAHLLGFGYDHLKQDQLFWVLSRLWVKIERIPVWKDNLVLETWSRGTDGFFGYRDFRFFDQSEEVIIKGTSSWLVLDAASKRIKRLSDFNNFAPYQESLFGFNASKVESPVSDEELQFSPVLFNEIDINQHFNTGRYLERVIDSYDFEFHGKNELIEFEVNFLKEGMPSDKLAVKKQTIDGANHLCSVVRQTDGAELIRVRLVWKDRGEEFKV